MRFISRFLTLSALFSSVTSSASTSHDLSSLLHKGASPATVAAAAKVGPLPGITHDSFAGTFSVNSSANANHFFWFWPALNGNKSAPLLVWMQGGPGSSSLFGLFCEHGPYRLNASLYPIPAPYSWANEYNSVYLDNPRGTGYSYADILCTDWTCYGSDFDVWMRQFQTVFGSMYTSVVITGESYGGHYVPASAYTVFMNNAVGILPSVPLAGIAIGNGFSAPLEMVQGYADIIYNAGLLSPSEYLTAQSYQANITTQILAEDYVGAYLTWDAFLNGDSTLGGAWFTNVTGLTNYFNVAIETPPDFSYYSAYVTSNAVRNALGVGTRKYNDGNLAVELALTGDVMFTQKPRIEALLTAGLRVLIYNGALDLICGAPLTERYVPLLQWPGAAAFNATPKALWHDPIYPGGAISGYARETNNFVNVVMRGAGHVSSFMLMKDLFMRSKFLPPYPPPPPPPLPLHRWHLLINHRAL